MSFLELYIYCRKRLHRYPIIIRRYVDMDTSQNLYIYIYIKNITCIDLLPCYH